MADFAIYYIVDVLQQQLGKVASGPAAVKLLFGDKHHISKHHTMMGARPNIAKLKASAQWADYGPHMTGKGPFGQDTHTLGFGNSELEEFEIFASKLIQCISGVTTAPPKTLEYAGASRKVHPAKVFLDSAGEPVDLKGKVALITGDAPTLPCHCSRVASDHGDLTAW
jgi:hypothetical protein